MDTRFPKWYKSAKVWCLMTIQLRGASGLKITIIGIDLATMYFSFAARLSDSLYRCNLYCLKIIECTFGKESGRSCMVLAHEGKIGWRNSEKV